MNVVLKNECEPLCKVRSGNRKTLGQVMNVNTFGNDVKKMIIMNVVFKKV